MQQGPLTAEVRPRLGQLSVAEGGPAAGKIVPLLLPLSAGYATPHTGAQYFVMTVCRLRPGSLSKLENLRSEGGVSAILRPHRPQKAKFVLSVRNDLTRRRVGEWVASRPPNREPSV